MILKLTSFKANPFHHIIHIFKWWLTHCLCLSLSLFFVGGLGWPGKQMKNRIEKCFFVVEIEQVKRPWTWSLLTCPHSRVVSFRNVHHLRAKDLLKPLFVSYIKHTLEVKKIKILTAHCCLLFYSGYYCCYGYYGYEPSGWSIYILDFVNCRKCKI